MPERYCADGRSQVWVASFHLPLTSIASQAPLPSEPDQFESSDELGPLDELGELELDELDEDEDDELDESSDELEELDEDELELDACAADSVVRAGTV